MEMKILQSRGQRFFIREAEEKTEKGFEERMLQGLAAPHLLCFHVEYEKEKRLYLYHISEMEAANKYWENRKLCAAELQSIVLQLSSTAEFLEKHMLREENMILSPEAIMVGQKENDAGIDLYFCTAAGESRTADFQKEARELLSFLLQKAEIREENALRIAFALYQQSLSKEISLAEWRKTLEDVFCIQKKREAAENSEPDAAENRKPQTRNNAAFTMPQYQGEQGTDRERREKEAGWNGTQVNLQTQAEAAGKRQPEKDKKEGFSAYTEKTEYGRNKKNTESTVGRINAENTENSEETGKELEETEAAAGPVLKSAVSLGILSTAFLALWILRGVAAAMRFLPAFLLLSIGMILFFAIEAYKERYSRRSPVKKQLKKKIRSEKKQEIKKETEEIA